MRYIRFFSHSHVFFLFPQLLFNKAPAGCSRKRAGKAADRTGKWLAEYAAFSRESSSGSSGASLLGVVAGGADSNARRRSAEAVAGHDLVGVAVGGLGGGGLVPEARAEATHASLAPFPATCMRVSITGFSSPSEVIAPLSIMKLNFNG